MASIIKRKKNYSIVYNYTDEMVRPGRNGKPAPLTRTH